MLRKVADVPGVKQVISPFTPAGAAEISKNGHTAYATVLFSSTKHAGRSEDLSRTSTAHTSVSRRGTPRSRRLVGPAPVT